MEPNQNRIEIARSERFSKRIAVCAILISFAFLIPKLIYPRIHFGQMGKQSFAAQMIESTAKGELAHGVFPFRHFVELDHSGVIPWAEEVPLYSFMSAALIRAFNLTPIQAGKAWSFIALIFIALGFLRIGKTLKQPQWIFVSIALLFPVFRLYSVQVMPDLCMTAALVWMLDFALREEIASAALLLLIASLFKYYAVFTGFGLGLYYLYRKNWTAALGLTLVILPCLFYVFWFINLGIPNPITEYRGTDGHGHLSSIQNILSGRDWRRVGLWWFGKNASLPGTILALVGAFFTFKTKTTLRPFWICLWISFITFPAIFMSSFYVHDYYGLQGSIGIALFAAIGLSKIYEWDFRLGSLSIGALLLVSILSVNFMTNYITDFDVIEESLQKLAIPKDSFVLSVSGISKPVLSFHLGQNAYLVGVDEWSKPKVMERIFDSRIHYAFVHIFKDNALALAPIEAGLILGGFKKIELKLNLTNTVFQAWSR